MYLLESVFHDSKEMYKRGNLEGGFGFFQGYG